MAWASSSYKIYIIHTVGETEHYDYTNTTASFSRIRREQFYFSPAAPYMPQKNFWRDFPGSMGHSKREVSTMWIKA